jgi:hypothetical protein
MIGSSAAGGTVVAGAADAVPWASAIADESTAAVAALSPKAIRRLALAA